MPGELNITFDLLGPENRTLAGVASEDDNGLNLFTDGGDILIFSNDTLYNVRFIQLNDMDVVDEYTIFAEVNFTIAVLCLSLLL